MKSLFALSFVFVIIMGTSQAHAIGVSAIGGLSQSGPATGTDGGEVGLATNSRTAFGGGILVSMPVLGTIELETGALYLPRKFGKQIQPTTGAAYDLQAQMQSLQIPVVAKWAIPQASFVVVGAGAYYASHVGQVGTWIDKANYQELSFSQFGIKKSDFGLLGTAGVKFPVAESFNVVADARYIHGLSNVSTSTSESFRFRDLQALAGVNYVF